MASGTEIYRESQSRLHNILGAYLSMLAWKDMADGVVIPRTSLLNFLELERMKNIRIEWLEQDLYYLFPYIKTTNFTDSGKYASLYLSRVELPKI